MSNTPETAPSTTNTEAFERIEQNIAEIRTGIFGPNIIDEDDTPVRDAHVILVIHRDEYGDWRLKMSDQHGTSSGNFGPRPGNMLAGVFNYLRECKGGDWTAFNRETGRAI